jgi:hydroxymethylbilane synthase
VSAALRIGTRGSRLALWQAGWVRDRLAGAGVASEVVVVKTQGDTEVDRPLHELAGTGFFTKGIEDALLEGRIDLAVHSLKDLPTTLPPGLMLGAVPPRVDARDVLVARQGGVTSLAALAPGTRVGTSSLRRVAQVRHLRADLEVVPLRGNVPTRVQKVQQGAALDAAILAFAGLARLELTDAITLTLDPLELMPAPGQGALGLEVRTGDAAAQAAVRPLDHPETARQVAAERSLLAALGGGCQAPVAAYVAVAPGSGDPGPGRLYGRVTSADGAVQLTASSDIDDPLAAGVAVADLLRARGALELLGR